MFEARAVDDGKAALADHPGARPVHVAALVVAAKVVVVRQRHLGGSQPTQPGIDFSASIRKPLKDC